MQDKKVKPRILPHNLEAEQSLLGCLFIGTDAQTAAFSKVKAEDFYSLAHRKIFDAMQNLNRTNVAIDYVTVSKELEKQGNIDEVGGIEYIVELTNIVPSAANYRHYIDIVLNDSILRQLVEVGNKTVEFCLENQDGQLALQNAEKLIFDLSKKQQISSLTHISEGVAEVLNKMEKSSIDPNAYKGVRTGFASLDRITNGLQKGDLILLAARPSMGKTTLGLNICNNASIISNASVAVFSLEMPISQLAQKSLCSTGYVKMDDVKRGSKDTKIWDTLFDTQSILNKTRLYIDDSSLTKPTDILSKCKRLKREVGLDLVMIDYLQLMTSDSKTKENRQVEVSEITRSLKIAARELEVPIILLSQLSRDIEKRTDRKPQLSDLRESGAIEQDADIVMFISNHKEKGEAGDENTISTDEDRKLVIAKHRNGELATLKLKWAPQFSKFYDAEDKSANFKINKKNMQTNSDILTPVEDEKLKDAFSTDNKGINK